MEKIIQNKDFKGSLIFTFIGLIASICAEVYQVTMLTDSIKQRIISQIGSIEILLPIVEV